MALRFTFLAKSRAFAVIGPPEEMHLGPVRVERADGEVKTERIIKLSKIFDTADGPRRYGFISDLPRGHA